MQPTLTTDATLTPFLDVEALIDSSVPTRRVGGMRVVLVLAGVLIAFSLAGASAGDEMRGPLNAVTAVLLLAVLGGGAWTTTSTVHRQRRDQQALDDVEELIQLRHWEGAARGVEALLIRPARSPRFRAQALVELSAILTRYGRFDDAIAVQTHLLESEPLDDASSFAVRLGRAMAILREDHLLDADRAISDLKKRSNGKTTGAQALVELYRDVKTGHPAEAISALPDRLPIIRLQMGHRVADAHALHARALDMLNRNDEAAAAFERATLLAPAGELLRRYPEIRPLFDRYTPAAAPAEAA